MLRRHVVCATIASAPLLACSLLLGEGYTDPDTTVAGDSGAAQLEAGDATSGSDSANGGNDADTPPDGASDAAVGCPSGVTSFCDDFERVDPRGDWGNEVETNGGALATIMSGSGRRLHSTVALKDSNAFLSRKFIMTPKKLHLEATLEYGSLPSTGDVHLMGVGMQAASESPSIVYLYADTGGVWFVEQVADSTGNLYFRTAVALPSGAPHRVVVDVVFVGTSTVLVDGTKAVEMPTKSYLVPANPEVSIGASQLGSTAAGFTLYADDFVFTAD